MSNSLEREYKERIVPEMIRELGVKNRHQVPRLSKITVNMGLGEAGRDKGVIEAALRDMELIAAQKPIVTTARKSIAGFSIREGWPIGCKVTLRRTKMYDFLERLIWVAIPRIRDFRGYGRKSFDGRGNYTLGIQEQIVFPEIDYDKIDKIRGMDVTITTTAANDEDAARLLDKFRFPLKAR